MTNIKGCEPETLNFKPETIRYHFTPNVSMI
jgi:hypothetical protein